jgi:hypothetical protein
VEVKVHDSVELPDPVTVDGESVHEVLFVVRLTIPANPLTADTVIVEVPGTFTLTGTLVGLAVRVKSWTVTVMPDVECLRVPLVAETSTV